MKIKIIDIMAKIFQTKNLDIKKYTNSDLNSKTISFSSKSKYEKFTKFVNFIAAYFNSTWETEITLEKLETKFLKPLRIKEGKLNYKEKFGFTKEDFEKFYTEVYPLFKKQSFQDLRIEEFDSMLNAEMINAEKPLKNFKRISLNINKPNQEKIQEYSKNHPFIGNTTFKAKKKTKNIFGRLFQKKSHLEEKEVILKDEIKNLFNIKTFQLET